VIDRVAVESPLEVSLNGAPVARLMRLPGDDAVLAAGFLFSEGYVKAGSLLAIRLDDGTDARGPEELAALAGEGAVCTAAGVDVSADVGGNDRSTVDRGLIRTGSGGMGLTSDLEFSGAAVGSPAVFGAAALEGVPDRMLAMQPVFEGTGAAHAAGAFDTSGNILVVREDVGRHNALDKVLGCLLLAGEPPAERGMMLSGRLSFEMTMKVARAGIPLVCSVSAPTALGIDLGRKAGMTLVGFLRGDSFNIYSHPERIAGERWRPR